MQVDNDFTTNDGSSQAKLESASLQPPTPLAVGVVLMTSLADSSAGHQKAMMRGDEHHRRHSIGKMDITALLRQRITAIKLS